MIRRTIRAADAFSAAGLLMLGAVFASCGGSTEPPVTVATVEVTPTEATRQVGETVQLSAAVKDANGNLLSGQSVSWSSSASAVASVSTSGLVTSNAIGSAVITAAVGNKSGVSAITVSPPPVASISVAPTNDTLFVRETVTLTPTLRDANNTVVTGRTVTWVSTSPNIATVSGTGLVTGVGDGTATITASADGKSASATIRVFDPCLISNARSIAVGQTINGSLATLDCKLDDDTFADGHAIQVATTTNVQIDMTASFDTYLYLFELSPTGTLALATENDDVDPDDPANPNDPVDTNSRITFNLVAGTQYFILANSFDPNVFGNYTLKVVTAGAFMAVQDGYTKPGKAPILSLLKSLRIR